MSVHDTKCMDFDTFQTVTGVGDSSVNARNPKDFKDGFAGTTINGNKIGVFEHKTEPYVVIQMIRPFNDGGHHVTTLTLHKDAANLLQTLLNRV